MVNHFLTNGEGTDVMEVNGLHETILEWAVLILFLFGVLELLFWLVARDVRELVRWLRKRH